MAASLVLVVGVGCETSNAETPAEQEEPLNAADGEAASPQENPLKERTKGSDDAPITVVEMSDFQCPFCQQFATQTLPALVTEYIETGKVRFVPI